MAKKKSWLERIRRLFVSEPKPQQEKSGRRKRWIFGSFKTKRPRALPSSSPMRTMSLAQAEQGQSKHALAVAAATTAAAVAVAQAAAEVVRVTRNPSFHHDREAAAAVKIQAAFRGYLARKALQALRGLVKLQALVRGQAVRRQANATLKGLQSMMKIQSQACANRLRTTKDHLSREYKDIIHVNSKDSPDKRSSNSDRDWNNSILSKDDINAVLENRREAAFKRLRALQYASNHQRKRNSQTSRTPITKLHDPQADDLNQRWSWLERWVDAQLMDNDPPERIIPPSPDNDPHAHRASDKVISVDFQDIEKAEEVQLRYLARRSFLMPQRASTKDDNSLSSSPSLPGYMESTASAKAKLRSISTPKQRIGQVDICYDQCITPNRTRPFSPFSDVCLSKTMTPLSVQRRSPRVKNGTAVRSLRSSNHLSFDSEFCFLNWDQTEGFR